MTMCSGANAQSRGSYRDHDKAIEIDHYTHVFYTTYNRRWGFVARTEPDSYLLGPEGPKAAGRNSGHKIGADQESRGTSLKLLSIPGASSFIGVDHLQKPKSFFMELIMYRWSRSQRGWGGWRASRPAATSCQPRESTDIRWLHGSTNFRLSPTA